MTRCKERGTRRKFSRVRFGHRPHLTPSHFVRRQPSRKRSAEPEAASRTGSGQPNRKPPSAGSKATFARLYAAASFAHAPHPIAFSCRSPPRTFSPPSEMAAPPVPGRLDHSPQVEGGIVRRRHLSPSGVSLCVSRSCIASCCSADRLSRFHGAQAYSG